MPQNVTFFLPFEAGSNPDAARAGAHHLDWIRAHGLVRGEHALRRYREWLLTDLAGYAYPEARGADLDLVTDAVCIGFPLDDQFDGPRGSHPEHVARLSTELAAIPYREPGTPPALDTPLTRAYTDVWRRSAEGMSAQWRTRAAATYTRFFRAYVEEAHNRRSGALLDEKTYITLRREAVGTGPCFDLIERAGHFELPEDLYWSPGVQTLLRGATDVIFLCNDAHSVEREEAQGDPHNLVLITQRTRGCSRADALERVGALVRNTVRGFQDTAHTLLQRYAGTPERELLARHIAGLRHWMIGNQRWGTVSARYATENIGVEVIPDDIGSAGADRSGAISGPTAGSTSSAARP
ncbi:hypothetical protein HUT13_06550 [Streptomyces harbinensis]|uniref:terpene synthase family protein n=1 Tax=Streptomyces TaxID=1883 RepID=UPI00031F1061|nr:MULTISPECIES: hypothetical protein [Streptomyces]QKV68480.1 hypothetical protein HUT13_06550 [Streptomyces harbinensis]